MAELEIVIVDELEEFLSGRLGKAGDVIQNSFVNGVYAKDSDVPGIRWADVALLPIRSVTSRVY